MLGGSLSSILQQAAQVLASLPTPLVYSDMAQTMVGELYVMYESLRRVAVRHPEIEYEQWQASTALSGGR